MSATQKLLDALIEGNAAKILQAAKDVGEAIRAGLIVELPCKVGDTVYVIAKCADITMRIDDDWETGTGARECPFEYHCSFEDCDDAHKQILETTATDFWYGTENGNTFEIYLDHMSPVRVSDFGKTIFLTRKLAEAALSALEKEGDTK